MQYNLYQVITFFVWILIPFISLFNKKLYKRLKVEKKQYDIALRTKNNTKHLKKFLRRKKKRNQSMDQSELVGKTKAGGNEFFWIGRGAIKIAMSMD